MPRYLFGGPGQLSRGPKQPVSTITIPKINMSGCSARGLELPRIGQKFELSFQWRGQEFRCEVEIVSKEPKGEAGLKFLFMNERRVEVLRKLCRTLRLEPIPELSSERADRKASPHRKRTR